MLETTWFVIWGVLWAVYFMLDGFDFGVGMLFPWLGKTDDEKRAILGSIAPFWDGNEVWLITAGGVTFAAFPAAYAVLFSALYSPLMIVLFALIVRAVSLNSGGRSITHPGAPSSARASFSAASCPPSFSVWPSRTYSWAFPLMPMECTMGTYSPSSTRTASQAGFSFSCCS